MMTMTMNDGDDDGSGGGCRVDDDDDHHELCELTIRLFLNELNNQ